MRYLKNDDRVGFIPERRAGVAVKRVVAQKCTVGVTAATTSTEAAADTPTGGNRHDALRAAQTPGACCGDPRLVGDTPRVLACCSTIRDAVATIPEDFGVEVTDDKHEQQLRLVTTPGP